MVQPRRNSLSVNSSMDIESLKGQKLEQVSLLEDKPQLWDYYNEGEIKMIKVKKMTTVFSVSVHAVRLFGVFYDCVLSTHVRCF